MAKASLTIGIDGTCLGVPRGYGRSLRELLPPLVEGRPEKYVVFVDRHTDVAMPDLPVRWVRPATGSAQANAAGDRSSRRLADLLAMRRAILRERLDLMFFPSVFSYVPLPRRLPQAVCLHDTIAERYGRIVFGSALDRWLWHLKVRMATSRARGILTVSTWSRDSLVEVLGLAASDIHVTTGAAAPNFHPPSDPAETHQVLREVGLDPAEPYLLYVGGRNPHKNLPRALRAFAAATHSSNGPRPRFVLAGDDASDSFHAEAEVVEKTIADLGIEDLVRSLGRVSDELLRHLYVGALAVVLVSLEEGLGFPALEGAACGTPCVATNRSPLPELLSGGGLFVDPESEAEITAAIAHLIADPEARREMGATAKRRSSALSWEDTARATREALYEIAGAPL